MAGAAIGAGSKLATSVINNAAGTAGKQTAAKAGGSVLSKTLAASAKGGIIGVSAGASADAAMQLAGNKDHKVDLKQTAKSAVLGGIAGASVAGGQHAVNDTKLGQKLLASQKKWDTALNEKVAAVKNKVAGIPSEGGSKADLGNKLDYQFGKAGGNKHNIDRTTGLKSEMDKLGFDDTPENRAYFEQYYNDGFQ